MTPLAGKRILLVEDEFIIAMMAVDLLEELGAEVVGPAARVADALVLAEAEALDAAVLDINMSGERSDPVAELLVGRGVAVVFATGYGSVGWAGAAGAPVVEKPYTAAKLAEALQVAMGSQKKE